MDRQQKIERVKNQHGGVSKISNLEVNTNYIHPDYAVEPCDGVRGETGKLEILRFVSDGNSYPYFIGRWDQATEHLDIDMHAASNTAKRKFKKEIEGFLGHHPNRNADPNKRTFEMRIETPSIGLIFDGDVSFANTFEERAELKAEAKVSFGMRVIRAKGVDMNGEGKLTIGE